MGFNWWSDLVSMVLGFALQALSFADTFGRLFLTALQDEKDMLVSLPTLVFDLAILRNDWGHVLKKGLFSVYGWRPQPDFSAFDLFVTGSSLFW